MGAYAQQPAPAPPNQSTPRAPGTAPQSTSSGDKSAGTPAPAPKTEAKHDYAQESFVVEQMHSRYRFEADGTGSGWNAPPTAPWLREALTRASVDAYAKEPVWMGEGGAIPFIAMLGAQFPHAQFVITGVLGPQSNAHGPNEFLMIPYAKKLTAAIAQIVAQAQI